MVETLKRPEQFTRDIRIHWGKLAYFAANNSKRKVVTDVQLRIAQLFFEWHEMNERIWERSTCIVTDILFFFTFLISRIRKKSDNLTSEIHKFVKQKSILFNKPEKLWWFIPGIKKELIYVLFFSVECFCFLLCMSFRQLLHSTTIFPIFLMQYTHRNLRVLCFFSMK